MLFTFAGSSHNKYTGYLLEMIAFLEIDAGCYDFKPLFPFFMTKSTFPHSFPHTPSLFHL